VRRKALRPKEATSPGPQFTVDEAMRLIRRYKPDLVPFFQEVVEAFPGVRVWMIEVVLSDDEDERLLELSF
jgi:hypothetical protein